MPLTLFASLHIAPRISHFSLHFCCRLHLTRLHSKLFIFLSVLYAPAVVASLIYFISNKQPRRGFCLFGFVGGILCSSLLLGLLNSKSYFTFSFMVSEPISSYSGQFLWPCSSMLSPQSDKSLSPVLPPDINENSNIEFIIQL